MTTIHTRCLTTIHTRHLKIQHVQKVNNTKECPASSPAISCIRTCWMTECRSTCTGCCPSLSSTAVCESVTNTEHCIDCMLWRQWKQCICTCLLHCVQWMNQRWKSETGETGIPTEGGSSRVSTRTSVQQLAAVSELHTFSSYRAVNTSRLGYKNQSEMKAACSESHTKHMIKKTGSEDSNQIQDPITIVAHLSSSCDCNTFWLLAQSCDLDQSMKQNCTYLQCKCTLQQLLAMSNVEWQ
jgi:hypothetical protein